MKMVLFTVRGQQRHNIRVEVDWALVLSATSLVHLLLIQHYIMHDNKNTHSGWWLARAGERSLLERHATHTCEQAEWDLTSNGNDCCPSTVCASKWWHGLDGQTFCNQNWLQRTCLFFQKNLSEPAVQMRQSMCANICHWNLKYKPRTRNKKDANDKTEIVFWAQAAASSHPNSVYSRFLIYI